MKSNVFLVALLCVALSACSYPEKVQREVIVRGFNFAPYTEKGFLFTPLLPSGEYESIGLISVTVQPGLYRGDEKESAPAGHVGAWYGGKRYWVEDLKPDDAIREMYKAAVGMGANALTQFTITSENMTTSEGRMSVKGFTVTGYAVKRK